MPKLHEKSDYFSKLLLSDKELLWYLMKYCIEEYKDLSKEEIIKLIEDGNVNNGRIKGINTEDLGLNDSKVVYDILYTSALPKSSERIGLYINIEAQSNYHPGYPIVKRAMYYVSRLLSKQSKLNDEFNYKNIKKVYSIWICTSPSIKRQNTINIYNIRETNVCGAFREDIKNYDLLNVVVIYLANNKLEEINEILHPLNLVFKNNKFKMNEDEVYEILEKKYKIRLNRDEVKDMWDMHTGYIQEGKRIGKKEGKLEGIAQGELNLAIKTVKFLITDKNMSLNDAINYFPYSKELKDKLFESLKTKYN